MLGVTAGILSAMTMPMGRPDRRRRRAVQGMQAHGTAGRLERAEHVKEGPAVGQGAWKQPKVLAQARKMERNTLIGFIGVAAAFAFLRRWRPFR